MQRRYSWSGFYRSFMGLAIGFICATALVMGHAFAQSRTSVSSTTETRFKKVFIVVFENTDFAKAANQPFFAQFAKGGALLANFQAEIHPSQGNYIAMVAGDTFGVNHDKIVNLDGHHLVDLLEAKGKSWKVYAEQYPGDCFLGATRGGYARKHVPFLSFKNVQNSPIRCQKIVNAGELDKDLANDSLPDYSLYIPDLKHDGHDTGVAYADRWFKQKFGPLLQDSRFTNDLLFVATFDESASSSPNHIYTALFGPSVQPGTVSNTEYNHYSLIRMIEDAWNLGTLRKGDWTATPIDDVWN